MNAIEQGPGRPTRYTLKNGQRVPGVTTIVSRFKDSGGLIHWAYQCGVDGIDYRAKRDAAADAGHHAHAAIEAVIHGRAIPPCPVEHKEAVDSVLVAFGAWRDQVKLEVIATEVPLVSERYKFGGTFDALLRVSGQLVLGDWKSGARVYPDFLAQMGGYDILLEERGDRVEGVQLLRFGKEHGDWHVHGWPRRVLDVGRAAFLHQRELFDLDAQLKKAVG